MTIRLNGHGDVIKLTDDSGSIVAEYEYDVWGNILAQSGSMAASNPFRYAGYMYDEETGLYYLLAGTMMQKLILAYLKRRRNKAVCFSETRLKIKLP
ncbi:MAG: RHS repeat domain-containing protein [Peptococcaceae bacterium]